MTAQENNRLGKTLWGIADQLRGVMDADDFRDYMLGHWLPLSDLEAPQ